MNLNINQIVVGERYRKEFNLGTLTVLSKSIKENGLINPLTVKKLPDGKYLLLAGERRYRAAQMALIETIPVHVIQTENELADRTIELLENTHRDSMTPEEECNLTLEIHRLQIALHGEKVNPTDPDDEGWTMRKTADLIGDSVAKVSRDISLAEAGKKLPDIWEGASSKRDAQQALKRKRRKAETIQKVQTFTNAQEKKPKDLKKKDLIDSYIVKPIKADPMNSGFFEMSEGIPDKTFDFIELDPPYGIELNSVKQSDTEETKAYTDIDPAIYPEWIKKMLEECYRVLKNHSFMICWFAPEPWFETIYQTAYNAGFGVRRLCGEWIKGKGQTNQPYKYLGNATEWFFYMEKGYKGQLNKPNNNSFLYPPVSIGSKIHTTERPVEMMQDIIETFTVKGSRILVPCAGSGNTLLAAANHNCTSLGIDVSSEYKDEFSRRVISGTYGKYKSYKGDK